MSKNDKCYMVFGPAYLPLVSPKCLKLRTFKVAFSPSKKIHNKAADLHVPERARSKRRLPWTDEDICKKRKAL